jgi:hypothetical protein
MPDRPQTPLSRQGRRVGVEEPAVSHTKELRVYVSHDGGQISCALRHQEYHFSPPDTTCAREDWAVTAVGVTHLQLWMQPDTGGLSTHSIGSAIFVLPGLGPLIVFGPLVGWIVGALEGAVVVGGLSALGAGLYSIGIPTDSIVEYETALKVDKFLVIAHGTADEVATATRIIETNGASYTAAHAGIAALV